VAHAGVSTRVTSTGAVGEAGDDATDGAGGDGGDGGDTSGDDALLADNAAVDPDAGDGVDENAGDDAEADVSREGVARSLQATPMQLALTTRSGRNVIACTRSTFSWSPPRPKR
jgi:hypothetical protein